MSWLYDKGLTFSTEAHSFAEWNIRGKIENLTLHQKGNLMIPLFCEISSFVMCEN